MYIYFLKFCYSLPFLVNSKGHVKLYKMEVLKFIFIQSYTLCKMLLLFLLFNFYSRNIVGKKSEMPIFSKRPWPCPFVLPDFPPYIKTELEKKCYASRKIRLQVIRIMYDHILQYTE